MTWELFTRDRDLVRTGLVDDFSALSCALRFNDVSSWTLSLPFDSPAAERLTLEGGGLIVVRDDDVLVSGPAKLRSRTWGTEDLLVVSGFDDTVWLKDRPIFPCPLPFTASDADAQTGPAETVMRYYVNANAGPGATSDRQVLTVAADEARGTTIPLYNGRFQTLLAMCQDVALDGGGLGFRVVQSGAALLFEVYEPSDLTGVARLSDELGNVESFELEEAAATVNYVIVGGLGEGASRAFITGGDSESISLYGRIERFVDARSDDDAADLDLEGLTQAHARVLLEEAAKTSLRITPEDSASLRFRSDYNLGDRITASVGGVTITEQIREVTVELDSQRARVTPRIGTPGDEPERAARLAITDRLTNLEIT